MNRGGWEGLNMSTRWLGMLLRLPHHEVAGWGGIYSHQPNCSRWRRLLAMGAPDSPVRHRTVSGAPPRHPDIRAWCWSTVGGFLLMRNQTVRCPSDQLLWLLPRSLCCTVRCQSRPLRVDSRCSAGTPDSLVNYSGAAPRKPEAEEFEVDPPWCTRHCLVRQTREHFGFLCSFLFEPF
jgi:hypothetical protein